MIVTFSIIISTRHDDHRISERRKLSSPRHLRAHFQIKWTHLESAVTWKPRLNSKAKFTTARSLLTKFEQCLAFRMSIGFSCVVKLSRQGTRPASNNNIDFTASVCFCNSAVTDIYSGVFLSLLSQMLEIARSSVTSFRRVLKRSKTTNLTNGTIRFWATYPPDFNWSVPNRGTRCTNAQENGCRDRAHGRWNTAGCKIESMTKIFKRNNFYC